tara:strand:+ start:7919 stop:8470 length:552 start_codon:yes stop_codon:yes gene_type:complete
MPIFAIGDKIPQIDPSAFIAPTATVVGDVRIESGVSIWYGAVIRGDTTYIHIGHNSNVQDGAVIHGRDGFPTIIGKEVSIAHNCVIHGATIKDGALIGNGTLILDGCTIGSRALIAAGAVVLPDLEIPSQMLVVGAPAVVKRSIVGSESEEWVNRNPAIYNHLATFHKNKITEIARDDSRLVR